MWSWAKKCLDPSGSLRNLRGECWEQSGQHTCSSWSFAAGVGTLCDVTPHFPWCPRERHPKPRPLSFRAKRSWTEKETETEKGPQLGGKSHLWEAWLFVLYSPACQGGRPASPTQMTLLVSLWAPFLWRPRLTGRARKLWVFKVLPTLPLVLVKIHCSYLCVCLGKHREGNSLIN